MRQKIGDELATIMEIRHPNVLRGLECGDAKYTNAQGLTEERAYLTTELAEGGELLDWLMYGGRFEEPVARFYFG